MLAILPQLAAGAAVFRRMRLYAQRLQALVRRHPLLATTRVLAGPYPILRGPAQRSCRLSVSRAGAGPTLCRAMPAPGRLPPNQIRTRTAGAMRFRGRALL